MKPRKSVQKRYSPILAERDALLSTAWWKASVARLAKLSESSEQSDDEYEIRRNVLDGVQREFPLVWSNYGKSGVLRLLGVALGHEDARPEKLSRLYPDVPAMPYHITEENAERVREEVLPGQLWIRVWGPGIGKLEGYIEWALREMKEQGADVMIGSRGRRSIPDADCIEAARLKDEGWTYRQIGEHFGWLMQPDPYDRLTKCSTAVSAVKRGLKLR